MPTINKKRDIKSIFLPPFLLGIFLAFIILGAGYSAMIFITTLKHGQMKTFVASIKLVEPVNAAEIYSEFVCGCCGRPLDPNNICCGDMRNKINYIDSQVAAGSSKDEIMMAAVKEFGVNSLAKAETRQAIKDKLLAAASVDSPKIVFEQTSYDFGEISQTDGIVFAYFTIQNKGSSNLVIDKLSTSCGCTSASVIYQEQEGPTFTMPGHGKENPKNWSVIIAPQDSAQVKVYYDPNAHGKQKEDSLSITRTISIFSNDPVEFEKQIRIELNQIP